MKQLLEDFIMGVVFAILATAVLALVVIFIYSVGYFIQRSTGWDEGLSVICGLLGLCILSGGVFNIILRRTF